MYYNCVNVTGIQLEPLFDEAKKTRVQIADLPYGRSTPGAFLRHFLQPMVQPLVDGLNDALNDLNVQGQPPHWRTNCREMLRWLLMTLDLGFGAYGRKRAAQTYLRDHRRDNNLGEKRWGIIVRHLDFDYDVVAASVTDHNQSCVRVMGTVNEDEAGWDVPKIKNKPRGRYMPTKGGWRLCVYRQCCVLAKSGKTYCLTSILEPKDGTPANSTVLDWLLDRSRRYPENVDFVGDAFYFQMRFLQGHPKKLGSWHIPEDFLQNSAQLLSWGMEAGEHRHFKLDGFFLSFYHDGKKVNHQVSTAWTLPTVTKRPPDLKFQRGLIHPSEVKILRMLSSASLKNLAVAAGLPAFARTSDSSKIIMCVKRTCLSSTNFNSISPQS